MLPKHLYENSSFTHTSPNLELNQLSINSKTIKQIVIGTHNGIPLNNNKNKLHPTMWMMSKRSPTKAYTMYYSIYEIQ